MSVAELRKCPECDKLTDVDAHFCQHCGAYLRWLDAQPPVHVEEGATTTEQEIPQAQVEVVAKGGAGSSGRPLAIRVEPGHSTTLTVRIRNVGPVVDGYAVRVDGIPSAWITLPDRDVDLMPIGVRGLYEGETTLVIAVPRSPDATAGERTFTIVAEAVARPAWSTSTSGTLTVGRYDTVVVSVHPQLVEGRRRAVFACEVRNGGNARIAPVVRVLDEQSRCQSLIDGQRELGLTGLAPGGTRTHVIQVAAPWRIIGAPRDHALKVAVEVDGLEHQPPPQTVTFRQMPIIPIWLPPLLLALATLAVAVIALITLLPEEREVPPLAGRRSAFAAQRILTEAGFKKAPLVKTRIVANVAPGTVVNQDPRAGRRVPEDTVVTVVVAAPPTITIIPDLRNHTVAGADGMLARAHLALGKVVPAGSPKRRIRSQIPRAGSVRPRGTVVNVVAAGPGMVAVPRVRCLRVSKAEAKLHRKGFEVAALPNFVGHNDVVRGQVPAAKELRRPGSTVTLLFKGPTCTRREQPGPGTGTDSPAVPETGVASASAPTAVPPGLTYDDGNGVLMDGRSLVKGTAPAWSDRGGVLAWRVDDDDLAYRRTGARQAPVLPGDAARATRLGLTFVPGGGTLTLAYLEDRRGSAALCFAKLEPAAVSCSTLGSYEPWALAAAPDGRHLAVVAARTGERRPGVLQLASRSAGSARAGDWSVQGPLVHPRRDGVRGAVYDATYSGHPSTLAVTTDLSPGGGRWTPRVVLSPVDGLDTFRAAAWTRVEACELAFEPNGARLAVIRPSGAGCSEPGQIGRLEVASLNGSTQPAPVARAARNVAWRPQP